MTQLRQYLDSVRRWFWLVVLGTVLAGCVGLGVSLSLTPIYRATATLLVNQAQTTTALSSYNDVLTSERLTRTYGELLKKRPVIDQVISDLGLDTTYDRLVRTIDVRPVRDTQLITVAVENPDPQLAATIANSVATVFIARITEEQAGQTKSTKEVLQKQIAELESQIRASSDAIEKLKQANQGEPSTRQAFLQSELAQYQITYSQLLRNQQEMVLAETRAANSVRLAEPAVTPQNKVRPYISQNAAIAAIIGLLLSVGLAFLIEYLDDAVRTPEIVEKASGLHALGAVSLIRRSSKRSNGLAAGGDAPTRLLLDDDARSPIGESFRILRTNIEFAEVDRACRVLLVTSANPGEGKSTISVNLAATFAQTGKRILVVDADLRRPTLHRTFGLDNLSGLTTLLVRSSTPLAEVVRPSPFPHLSVMTSGPIPPNPAELLGSARMSDLIEQLQTEFDLVVLDSPPTLAVTDPMVLAPRTDGVIVVVDSSRTSTDALARTADALRRANANVIGVILNKLTAKSGGYYYYYYRSYYRDREQTGGDVLVPAGAGDRNGTV